MAALEFEALASAASVVHGYDAVEDRWNFSFDSSFWKAVRHAHALGFTGDGQKVAIIDSGCNLGLRRLAERVDRLRTLVPAGDDTDPVQHGTAVALLLSEVAPACRLDIYRVADEKGAVDEARTIQAIEEAAESDATVVNLSLGHPRPQRFDDLTSAGPRHFRDKGQYVSEKNPCPLCQAASAAAARGKLVFAAVGNSLEHVYCPARADSVIAVGFQESKHLSQGDKQITYLSPTLSQAISSDLMLEQPAGVLGSSFACPLYAGVGALGISRHEITSYIDSYSQRTIPLMLNASVDVGPGLQAAPPSLRDEIQNGYRKTMAELPHAHCLVQGTLRPDLPITKPARCAFCGIFADLQYVHSGYWLAKTGHLTEALELLATARKLAPWSAEAAAYIGSVFFMRQNISQAIKNLEIAVDLRPGARHYVSTLATLRTLPRRPVRELIDSVLMRLFYGA
jgi:hypothetical protein